MHSVPSLYTFGWNISVVKRMRGGFSGLHGGAPEGQTTQTLDSRRETLGGALVTREGDAEAENAALPGGLVRAEDGGAPDEEVVVGGRRCATPLRFVAPSQPRAGRLAGEVAGEAGTSGGLCEMSLRSLMRRNMAAL
jgi:hypothetical protein